MSKDKLTRCWPLQASCWEAWMCAGFGGEFVSQYKSTVKYTFLFRCKRNSGKDFTLHLDKNYSGNYPGKLNSEDDSGEDATRMLREALQDWNLRRRNRTMCTMTHAFFLYQSNEDTVGGIACEQVSTVKSFQDSRSSFLFYIYYFILCIFLL